MSKKRVIYISTYAGFVGGIERYMAQTSQLLRNAGVSTEMYFLETSRLYEEFCQSFDIVARLERLDIFENADLITIHKLSVTPILKELLNRYYNKLLLVVHDHDIYCPRHHKYTPLGRKNCYRPYNPLRCFLCGLTVSPRNLKTNMIWDLLYNFRQNLNIYKKIPQTLVLSEFMHQNLIANGFNASNISIVPPAFSTKNISKRKHSTNTITTLIFVGQLIRGKGVENFLRMAKMLKNPYQALIIGDGNDRSRLEQMSQKLGLNEKIKFLGWQSPIEQYYENADIAIYPFHWQEPFGLVGLEANAYEIPVVAFDRGGCNQWLHSGNNGYLIKAGDITALAQAVDELIAHPKLRAEMGKCGQKLVSQKFNETNLLSEYFKLFLKSH